VVLRAADPATLAAALRAAEEADVCLVIGTSALVHPAAGIAHATARAGGRVVEVNPEATPLTAVADMSLRRKPAAVVPRYYRRRAARRPGQFPVV
jgi:NAD-dependent deacetylase